MLALVQIRLDASKPLTGPSQNSDPAWLRWAIRSLFHNKTSLIGLIWRTWNGLAATDEVSWLQTMLVLAQILFEDHSLIFVTFCGTQPNSDLVWQRWTTRSLFHHKSSLMGHIWRTWNGPEATDEVLWLQTMLVLAQIWLDALKPLTVSSQIVT
jgi:hypothetical protein